MQGRNGFFASAFGLSVLAATPAKAWNIDFCNAEVLQPIGLLYAKSEGIAAVDIPPTIEKGTVIHRVTQYVLDRKTGLTGFCAHFDTCYRATATVNGRQVKAVRLLNCTINFNRPYKTEDEVIYSLQLDPRRNSARDVRVDRAFERLLALGIESEQLAVMSVDEPHSRCGRLARRALAGDRPTVAALVKAQNGAFFLSKFFGREDADPNNYVECF